MQSLVGTYPIEHKTVVIGELLVTTEGLHTRFAAECTAISLDVLRLFVFSGERVVSLGVMFPEGGKIKFNKKFTRNDLREKGVASIDGCRLACNGEDVGYIPKSDLPSVSTPLVRPESISASAPPLVAEELSPKLLTEQESAFVSEPPSVPVLWNTVPEEPNTSSPVTPIVTTSPNARTEAAGWQSVNTAVLNSMPLRNTEQSAAYVPSFETSLEHTPLNDREKMPVVDPSPEEKWYSLSDPGELFIDPELKVAAREVTGALIRELEQHIELAVPFEIGRPFPLMPIFCLGRLTIIDNWSYLVFTVKEGDLLG